MGSHCLLSHYLCQSKPFLSYIIRILTARLMQALQTTSCNNYLLLRHLSADYCLWVSVVEINPESFIAPWHDWGEAWLFHWIKVKTLEFRIHTPNMPMEVACLFYTHDNRKPLYRPVILAYGLWKELSLIILNLCFVLIELVQIKGCVLHRQWHA